MPEAPKPNNASGGTTPPPKGNGSKSVLPSFYLHGYFLGGDPKLGNETGNGTILSMGTVAGKDHAGEFVVVFKKRDDGQRWWDVLKKNFRGEAPDGTKIPAMDPLIRHIKDVSEIRNLPHLPKTMQPPPVPKAADVLLSRMSASAQIKKNGATNPVKVEELPKPPFEVLLFRENNESGPLSPEMQCRLLERLSSPELKALSATEAGRDGAIEFLHLGPTRNHMRGITAELSPALAAIAEAMPLDIPQERLLRLVPIISAILAANSPGLERLIGDMLALPAHSKGSATDQLRNLAAIRRILASPDLKAITAFMHTVENLPPEARAEVMAFATKLAEQQGVPVGAPPTPKLRDLLGIENTKIISMGLVRGTDELFIRLDEKHDHQMAQRLRMQLPGMHIELHEGRTDIPSQPVVTIIRVRQSNDEKVGLTGGQISTVLAALVQTHTLSHTAAVDCAKRWNVAAPPVRQ